MSERDIIKEALVEGAERAQNQADVWAGDARTAALEHADACQAALAAHESEINTIVYRLFDLSEEEITLIESTLAS